MVHMWFTIVKVSRAIKLCYVPQFSATMKPIEPQGHLSKPNKISECYDISKYHDLKGAPALVRIWTVGISSTVISDSWH